MNDDERRDAEREVANALRSTAPVRASHEFRERLKRDFVTGAIDPGGTATTRRRGRLWIWVPAAAASIALLLLLWPPRSPSWSVLGVLGTGQVIVSDTAYPVASGESPSLTITDGGNVAVGDGVALGLAWGDRLLFELDEQADVALPVDSSPWVARVRGGELRVKTGPSFPGNRLRISTADGVIDITGTMVSVFKGKDLTCVCVLEGTAHIGVDDGDIEPVVAGTRKVMFSDGRPSMVTEIMPQHAEGLRAFVDRYRDAFR